MSDNQDNDDLTAPASKRRRRRPLNCWHCRIRKIKCDRTVPCSACLKSGNSATCSYILPNTDKEDALLNQTEPPGLEARINRLEGLVRSIASTKNESLDGASALSPPDSTRGSEEREVNEMTSKIGSMKVDAETNQTYYLGPSHWVSLLSEVEELRDYMHRDNQMDVKDAHDNYMHLSQTHISLLRGLSPAPSPEELLLWMPPRLVADMAVNKFFSSSAPTIGLLHAPTFKQQCAQHWEEPSKTPLPWLAMFYALLYVSEVTAEMDEYWQSGSTNVSGSETKSLYRLMALRYLLASNYTRPRMYTLEAMLLLLGGDYMTSIDAINDTTFMLSIMVRAAMSMGLHRSYQHPSLSPFQREMRRRLWLMIHCVDIMHATQISLPPNIRQEDVDLTPPLNLHDKDFGPNSVNMPLSRPLSEITPITYYLIKYKHCLALDKVIKFSESTRHPTHDQLRPYEDLVQETAQSIPPRLQLDFAIGAVAETTVLRKDRIQLDRLTQLNTCILYRGFLTIAHSDPKLFHYRRSCLDAAMRILRAQDEICSRHSNTTRTVPKNHLLTITSVDFYTAGMAIAMDLYHGLKSEPTAPKASDIKIWGYDRRPDMMAALARSARYWDLARTESIEAAKAWAVFGYVLEKARIVLDGASTSGSKADTNHNNISDHDIGKQSGITGQSTSTVTNSKSDSSNATLSHPSDPPSDSPSDSPSVLESESVWPNAIDSGEQGLSEPNYNLFLQLPNGELDWSFLDTFAGFTNDYNGESVSL